MTKRSSWNSDRIRKTFIRFFEERGHRTIPSSSLIPHGDPTLLFTNAGMVQFKPYFEGRSQPPAPRMCSVQKCFRTSDIDNVGDASHLTFFEMLGNFSVGDYFKEGAIPWAWELMTEVVRLPKDRLWAAVYLDDDEAFDLWRKVGVPAERIMRYGEEDNYWFSGDVGPCGPCSEIYYDFGATPGCPECEKGTCHPQIDCHDEHGVSRFLELWNLVFMTFYQHEDGSRTPLPSKNIDTGAGLERWAAVLLYESDEWKDRREKGVRASVYETDLFAPIIAKVAELSGRKYGEDAAADRVMRIVAEHARAAAFLIGDGVMPSNEGRGYALRRIMRRAAYYGHQLVWNVNLLGPVATEAVRVMYGSYSELLDHAALIRESADLEEKRFMETLGRGQAAIAELAQLRAYLNETLTHVASSSDLRVNWATRARPLAGMSRSSALPENLERAALAPIEELLGDEPWKASESTLRRAADAPVQITGHLQFLLWDTYGLPAELTREIAAEHGLPLHLEADEEFSRLVDVQRERARAAHRFGVSQEEKQEAYASLAHVQTRFVGYETLRQETTVAGIIAGTEAVASVHEGDEAEVVLHETPFYAEAGGQVGDQGELVGPASRFAVEDTQFALDNLVVHRGRVIEGRIAVNDDVVAQVDTEKRADTMRNHTGTHLLHSALRQVLGAHVRQAGSLVAPDRLRFDFTHMEAPKPEELSAIQALVNEKIRENMSVETEQKSYEEAIAAGALAFFGEKYAENVRVVEVCEPAATSEHEGCFSAELCGGTHCHATGEVGTLVIVKEESIGAGVRRIEALTGRAAAEYVREQQATLERLGRSLDASSAEIEAKVASLQEQLAAAEKRVQALERQAARREAEALLEEAERVDGAAVVVSRVSAASPELLREMGDFLRDRLGSAVIALGAVVNGRPSFVVMATADLTARGLHAGEIVKGVAAVVGGGGGGRPEMAQAGGKDADKLDDALATGGRLIRKGLASLREASPRTKPAAGRPPKSAPDKPPARRRGRSQRPGRASGRS